MTTTSAAVPRVAHRGVEASGTAPVAARWWVLAVMCLSLFIVVVDNTIVNVALPSLGASLAASTSGLQWIVDGYTLVFSALMLAGGHLGDRYGRRRTLQAGLVVFAATSGLAALTTTTGQLVVARGLMGVGAALVFPATLAIIIAVFRDPRERATAIGIWSAVTGLAVAAGPVTGGLLLEHFWWGSVFLVNVPVALLALAAVTRVVPESRDPHLGRLDLVGLALSLVAVGATVWAVIEGPHLGWTSWAVLAAAASGAVLLIGFVGYEVRAAAPLLDVRLFANRRFSAASAAIAAAFFGLFGFIFLITQYMQLVQGFTALESGVRTLPFAVATGVCSPLSILLMRKFGTTRVVAAGLAVMTGGFLYASTLDADSAYVGPVLIGMVTIAVGLGLTQSPATEAVMGAVSAHQAGVGSAVNDTTRELGGTLGVALVGSVFASVYGPEVVSAFASLPVEAQQLARDSVGGALAVAAQVPDGASIVEATRAAFMSGFGAGSLVAAAATGIGSLVALRWLPARAQD